MDLLCLPDLTIDCIVDNLPYKDQVNLSLTCSTFACYKPTFEVIQKGDVNIRQERGDHHYCPKIFFDVPIKHKGLKYVRMKFTWKDQGWGNQKGQVWLQLVRDGKVVESGHGPSGLAPQSWTDCDIEIEDENLIKNSVGGDILRVMRNTGGGGGHSLHFKNFRMMVVFKGNANQEKREEGDEEKEDEQEEKVEKEEAEGGEEK